MKKKTSPGSQLSVWTRLSDPQKGLAATTKFSGILPVFLVAHQDDETIGGSAIMSRLGGSVVYLTDGAPRDQSFWPEVAISGSRADYARMRREEAVEALDLAGISPENILSLSGVDQEASMEMATLAERFASLLRQIRPDVVITHPYEGGHPDHDAAALVARLATQLLARKGGPQLEVLEMTSYHLFDGQCLTGRFLPGNFPELVIHLSPEELIAKQKMVLSYHSQRLVLDGFRLDPERLRPAPHYDFTRAPHPGKLWYECLGWPMTGERWRELAAAALAHFGDEACA
jgi:LmbE family N-acetylglucosaminyl deacetylase